MTAGADLAGRIDHTLLRADASETEIDRLCDEAREHGFFAVCVNAKYVERCAERLAGAAPLVCSVVGFPLSACGTEAKLAEARFALDRGALELDTVVDLGAIKSGHDDVAREEVRALAELCHERGAGLKVILETCLLDESEKRRAGELAVEGGADLLKTSTGFAGGGATVADVRLLAELAGPERGVKAAGGIATASFARELIEAGATRLGCSRSLALLASAER